MTNELGDRIAWDRGHTLLIIVVCFLATCHIHTDPPPPNPLPIVSYNTRWIYNIVG